MSKKKQAKTEPAVDEKLRDRMLKVEDPVEMKTDPGSEILVATDKQEKPIGREDERAAEKFRRDESVHVRGLGQVTRD